MTSPNRFVEKTPCLYVNLTGTYLKHPEFADKIPDNALVVMQIIEDEEFNDAKRPTVNG